MTTQIGRFFLAAATLAAVVATPDDASAQGQSDRLHSERCRQAAHVLRSGGPEVRYGWAVEVALGCGGEILGDAASSSMYTLRTESDTSVLQRRMEPFFGFRDSAFYAAATAIARDAAATPAARLTALRQLLGIVHGGQASASYSSMGSQGENCAMAGDAMPLRPPGRPLPGDPDTIRAEVRMLAESLLADASTPAVVRSAAACVHPAVRY